MDRRAFLSAATLATTAVAGCTGGQDESGNDSTTSQTTTTAETTVATTAEAQSAGPMHGDDLPEDDDPNDGYPPAFETMPAERELSDNEFGSLIQDGVEVTTASIDASYYWYARGEARFVDARGTGQYETQHIYGAVNSPAEGNREDDPTDGWSKDDRIVCYCGCPHHLSSIKAVEFLNNGYENVYIIDEGYWQWNNRKYPMAGDAVSDQPSAITIVGATDPKHAGGTAWAIQESSDQLEATSIESDGRYSMELKFEGVTPSTPIHVRTPSYEGDAPLGSLTGKVVTGSDLD